MAEWQDQVEGLDEDEALGVFQGLLGALGDQVAGVQPQPQPKPPPPQMPPVIGSMTQGPQPQNPLAEAAAGRTPGAPAGSPPPTPPPGVSAAGGGALSGPPASKLQRNTTDPVQAQNPIEAPGVIPTYPQPGQAQYQQAQANDPVGEAQRLREQNARTTQRATRAQTALQAIQAILGIGGAAMGAVGGQSGEALRRAGAGLTLGARAIPTGLPGQIAEQRTGQRQQAFEGLLAARGDVRSQEYLDQQRRAMDLNEQRFGMQQRAQKFGQAQTLREEERAQAAEERTQGEYELQRRRQDKDSQESRDARAQFMAEYATIPQSELPAWQRTPEFAAYAANEATAEEVERWTQTMQPIHQRRMQERRGGRGGRGDGAGEIGPWERHLIEQGVQAGVPRAAATDIVLRGGRGRREYEQYIGQQQGRQAQEARSQADDAEMLRYADEAVGALDQLTPGQSSALMWGVTGGAGALGGFAQRAASAWEGLSDEEQAEVGRARQRAITLLQRVARGESGAAINRAEWEQFKDRLGLNAWTNDPEELAYMVRWYRRMMTETLAARQQAAGYVRPGSEVEVQAGDIPPPPQRFPFQVRRVGPNGAPQETTVRSSADWDRAYEMGFRPRPGRQ